MISSDLGDAHCRRIGSPQRGARLVQSLQQKVSHGTYAKELGATHPQRSLGYADVGAKRREGQFVVDAPAQRLFETNHDGGMMVSRLGISVRLTAGQAVDDGVKHVLLQGRRDLGTVDQLLSGFREMAGLPEKSLESGSFRAGRAKYSARG